MLKENCEQMTMNEQGTNFQPVNTDLRNRVSGFRKLVFRLGLATSVALTGVSALETADIGVVEPTSIASANTGGYPHADMPCLTQGPNYMKTTGTGYWCGDYNWGDPVTRKNISPRGFVYRNCTDWAAYRAHQLTGVMVPFGANMGHGGYWDDNAPRHGFIVDTQPEPGDIAVWNPKGGTDQYGHVAVVESINANNTVNISEYNGGLDGNYRTRNGVMANVYIDLNGTGKGISGQPIGQQPTAAPVDLPTFVPDIVQRPDGETNVAVVGPGNSLDFYYNRAGSPQWGKIPVAVGGYALSSPDMIQRPSGETNIAVVGKDNSLDFYINKQGSPAWGKLTVAGPGSAYSKPAIVQRPSGETNIAVRGPNNTLDFYYNFPGSPQWGKIPVATPNQAYSAPAMVQRPNGETDIAVLGPDNSLNFYFNQQGSPYWGLSRVAINGWAHSAPAMVQRPSTGETNIAVQGPNNTLDFYTNQQGSPAWGRIRAAGEGSTHTSPNAPAMVQRPNGETDIAVRGPGASADFYYNALGSPIWSKLPVAISGYSQRVPAMIQRPSGETNLAINGPNNRLDFYFNALGSPYWGNIPIAGNNSAS